jgi:hypothetical protein
VTVGDGADVIGEIDVGLPPHRQRVTEDIACLSGSSFEGSGQAARDEVIEAAGVDGVGRDTQRVSGLGRLDQVAGTFLAQRLTQVADVHVERLAGGLGRVVAPHRVDQLRLGHRFVRRERESRQHSALQPAADRELSGRRRDAHGTEDDQSDFRHGSL